MNELQKQVALLCQQNGYSETPQTLLIGAMEELGEVARAILLTECTDYKLPPNHRKTDKDKDVAAEIGDTITYLLALCNALGIEPKFNWK